MSPNSHAVFIFNIIFLPIKDLLLLLLFCASLLQPPAEIQGSSKGQPRYLYENRKPTIKLTHSMDKTRPLCIETYSAGFSVNMQCKQHVYGK